MAANVFGQYTRVTVAWNGQILFQESSVSMTQANHASPAKSVLLGFNGMTVGAGDITGKITNIVPSAGFEMDATPFINGVISGKITFSRGDPSTQIYTLTTNAWLTSSTLGHSVDANTSYEFDFMAQPAEWIAV